MPGLRKPDGFAREKYTPVLPPNQHYILGNPHGMNSKFWESRADANEFFPLREDI